MNSAGTRVFRRGVKLNSYNVFWWLQTYTLLSLFEVKKCYTQAVYPTSCPVGLFGVNCAFYCHCKPDGSRCNVDGQCLGGTPCEPGYFGAGCQYVDMCKGYCAPSVPSYLRDDNESTCNKDTISTSVTITLTQPRDFTWFRIYLNDASETKNFDVKINDNIQCQGERRVLYNDRTVDVMCDNRDKLEKIALSGSAVKKLCEIDISGGRAVSWFQPASQSAKDTSVDRGSASNVVSTKDNLAKGLCTRTQVVMNPYWQVTFNRPQVISEIRLVKKSIAVEFTSFNWALTNGMDALKGKIFPINQNGSSLYVFQTGTFKPATNFEITVVSKGVKTFLGLCQVEAFGETVCPEGTWGFGCEKNCSCPKFETCSVVTGVCHQPCPLGFYGLKCFQFCSGNCPSPYCNQRSGKCITGCPPKLYSDNCKLDCSSQCKDSLCDAVSGNCTDCPPTLYGNSCNLKCSSQCKDSLCDHTSGICNECILDRYGNDCWKLCPSNCKNNLCHQLTGLCQDCKTGWYGENCTDFCPTTCVDQLCDNVTMDCLACVEHWTGPKCKSCSAGWFGNKCGNSCPTTCPDQRCHPVTGKCMYCIRPRTGPICQDCERGFQGKNCTRVCPSGCQCDTITRICSMCIGHHAGPNCGECEEGWFGKNCTLSCPRICPDQCDKITGHCLSCVGRRIGPKCEDCPPRYYGALCDIPCTDYCRNTSCDQVDGVCYGCIDGYRGEYCGLEIESMVPSVWVLPLIVPFVLLVSCCFFLGGGDISSEEE